MQRERRDSWRIAAVLLLILSLGAAQGKRVYFSSCRLTFLQPEVGMSDTLH
jgi:hypothetical protein